MKPRPVGRVVLVRAGLTVAAVFAMFPLLLIGQEPPQKGPDDQKGGFDGHVPNSFSGRSSARARAKLVREGGGNAASEAAVALGLKWLALHQSNDGRWSLDGFHNNAHEKVDLGGKRFICNCGGQGMRNDTAGTAFGLLPFLGAGITHQSDAGFKENYTKSVDAAIKFLLKHQDKNGDLGGGMYAQGLATIALCEAYGLSGDKELKEPAQRAIDFIVKAQDPDKGGWRYVPRQGGDTSVTGWQVLALKSGQMAGLKVPAKTLGGAEDWLKSVQTEDGGGYGYVGPQETPTLSAVGLLCRQYLGWSPRNPGMVKGVGRLGRYPPGSINSMYYHYYATQVMHHMGGDAWAGWNAKMRDKLVETQDQGKDEKHTHQAGSWDPSGDAHGGQGGRIMQTSLSLLTLEVYYRHLPLYRREVGDKDEK